jgi:hypothetical protein
MTQLMPALAMLLLQGRFMRNDFAACEKTARQ